MLDRNKIIFAILLLAVIIAGGSHFLIEGDRIVPFREVRLPSGRFWVVDKNLTPRQFGYLKGSVAHSEWLYWHQNGLLSAREFYNHDILEEGIYFDERGQEVARVSQGSGISVNFTVFGVSNIRSYRDGRLNGPSVAYLTGSTVATRVKEFAEGRPHGHEVTVWKGDIIKGIRYHVEGVLHSVANFNEAGQQIQVPQQVPPLYPEGVPPLLEGARVTSLAWSNGVKEATYWAEQVDGVWVLQYEINESR